MSLKYLTAVWESGPEDRTELLVLLALADYADEHGSSYPAIKTIAKKARLTTERGAQKIVRRLEAGGWIKITPNKGQNGTNVYTVTPERLFTPNTVHPEQPAQNPRTAVHPNRNEPSYNIKRAAQFPENWMPNAKTVEWCISKQYDEAQIGAMVEDCVNHHRGKGNTFKDHDSAFRTWASNQIKFHGTPEQQRSKHVKSRSNQKQAGMAEDPALKQIARLAGLR